MDATTPNLEPDALTLKREMERIWSVNGLRDAHRTAAWFTPAQARSYAGQDRYGREVPIEPGNLIYHGPSHTAKGIKLMRATWLRRRRAFIASLYEGKNATK